MNAELLDRVNKLAQRAAQYERLERHADANRLDPGGVLAHFRPLYEVELDLISQGVCGDKLVDELYRHYCDLLLSWIEEGRKQRANMSDTGWLLYIAYDFSLAEYIYGDQTRDLVWNDFEGYVKCTADICPGVNPMQFAAIELSMSWDEGIEYFNNWSLPPGHPVWLVLGVKNQGEWKSLGNIEQITMACPPKRSPVKMLDWN
ncbi:hypothetical protein ACFLX5_02335 [Chloroflexota bacterium]